jgi:DNA modification methylase
MAVTVLTGHAPDVLRSLPERSVQCVATSPPYWALRRYGTPPQVWPDPDGTPLCDSHEWGPPLTKHLRGKAGQHATCGNTKREVAPRKAEQGQFCQRCGAWLGELGSEPTPDLYLAHLVGVFGEVWRVLRDDGTLWVNLGDSYVANTGAGGANALGTGHGRVDAAGAFGPDKRAAGIKPKNLALIPWRFAIAMQDAGWYVRSTVAWCKTAAMPESTRDRPTSAWEPVFLFTKSARYFYDQDAVRTALAASSIGRLTQETFDQQTGGPKDYANGTNPSRSARKIVNNLHEKLIRSEKWKARYEGWAERDKGIGANLRNYWVLGPEPLRDEHYAAFPTELVRRCIAAGSSERGQCPACGAPWRRQTERIKHPTRDVEAQRAAAAAATGRQDGHVPGPSGMLDVVITRGWEQGCQCPPQPPVPCVVLDPFSGSGTTLIVAGRLGRDALGIELQPEYVAMAERRITRDAPLLTTVTVSPFRSEPEGRQLALFPAGGAEG